MSTLYDQHGFPIETKAEMAEQIEGMSYDQAVEALYLLEGNLASRQGIFAGEEGSWASIDYSDGDVDRDSIEWNSVQYAGQLAYKYWIHNPLIRRGVETITQYVFGRGFSITAKEDGVRERAQMLWADPDIQHQMTGSRGLHRFCSMGQVYGNLFFALFPPGTNGKKVRRFEMAQVQRVLCDRWGDPVMWLISYYDPLQGQDRRYERHWVKSVHFRDMMVDIPSGEEEAMITDEYFIQHITFGTLVGPLGLPTFWPGLAWAKAYKSFLEDFAVISRSYRTFAWRVTGSNFDSLSSAKNMVTDAFTKSDESVYGIGRSAIIPNAQSDLSPIRTANYTTPADGGRRLALMCMAAFGLPETYFGDVSVGTYATGATVERPVELMMRYVQEVWAREIETMLSFLIDGDTENKNEITVTFPSILEHDVLPLTQALQTVGQLEYQTLLPRDLAAQSMHAFGITDVEAKLKEMEDEGYFDTTRMEQNLELQKKYAPEPAPGGAGGPTKRELGKNFPRKRSTKRPGDASSVRAIV